MALIRLLATVTYHLGKACWWTLLHHPVPAHASAYPYQILSEKIESFNLRRRQLAADLIAPLKYSVANLARPLKYLLYQISQIFFHDAVESTLQAVEGLDARLLAPPGASPALPRAAGARRVPPARRRGGHRPPVHSMDDALPCIALVYCSL